MGSTRARPRGIMPHVTQIEGKAFTLQQMLDVANGGHVEIAPEARDAMVAANTVVNSIVTRGDTVYGITTGFGKLSDVTIPHNRLSDLQLNLVRSHACGVGAPLSRAEVRLMLLLRANVLASGHSGSRPIVAETLAEMLNKGVHPVIPEQGSVGASGDLAPLAHLALVLIGEGHAELQGQTISGADAMRRAGITPITLGPKEGLAVLNGTQALSTVGAIALAAALDVQIAADIAAMMTLDALRDTPAAYDERIHAARPHIGQVRVARRLRRLIEGSEIRESHRHDDSRVQDAYSLRCIPQVHGAVLHALEHAKEVLEIESGSATDNPLVFVDDESVISGGNFHGAPVALTLDYAAIAMTDLSSISERRIERLVNPDLSEGLPPFLTRDAGMESGFMIPQVCAVALLNESKVLSHPASVDNVPTSAGKEDHVSMGMVAATKFRRVVQNASRVVAIEMLAAAQGIEFRRPLRSSALIEEAHKRLRAISAPLDGDRSLSDDIEKVASMIARGEFSDLVED